MNQLNYINIDTLMEMLLRELPPSIKVNREEVLENIYIATKLIGIKQCEQHISVLPLTSYSTSLPKWIDSIERVYYLSEGYNQDEIEADLITYMNNAEQMVLTDKVINDRKTTDYKYMVRNNTIYTSTDEGYIIVVYNSIPIDENGEMLIEDEMHFIQALLWYNIKHYLWQATIRNPNQFYQLYQKANMEWGYYSVNAKTASIFPKNEDELIRLRSKYLRLLPNFNA